MDTQLSQSLADVLKFGKDSVVNMALFVQQQAPELAKQVVLWGFWSNLVWVIFSPAIIFLTWYFHGKIRKGIEDSYEAEMVIVPYRIFGGILTIIFILVFFSSLEDVIKCVFSPKLYLIDYVRSLISAK